MNRPLNRYVQRATLGLPRHERLEMAAELRTHLLDRMRQLEAEGFSREEAEHLAVKGMGDVRLTNRQLLDHIFTTPLGWAVFCALLLGGGSWWVWQNVPLPMRSEASWKWAVQLTTDDLAHLYTTQALPGSNVKAATLRLPRQAEWLYTAIVSRDGKGVDYLDAQRLIPVHPEQHTSVNSTWNSRVLLGAASWTTAQCQAQGEAPRPQIALFLGTYPLSSLRPAGFSPGQVICPDVALPPANKTLMRISGWEATQWTDGDMAGNTHAAPRRLPMNEWTVLSLYTVDWADKQGQSIGTLSDGSRGKHVLLYAVMPADQRLHTVSAKAEETGSLTVITDARNWVKSSAGLSRPQLPKLH